MGRLEFQRIPKNFLDFIMILCGPYYDIMHSCTSYDFLLIDSHYYEFLRITLVYYDCMRLLKGSRLKLQRIPRSRL